jgi:hypothetical protein
LQQNAFCAELDDFLFYAFFLKIEAFHTICLQDTLM